MLGAYGATLSIKGTALGLSEVDGELGKVSWEMDQSECESDSK